jgi:adenine-specific DNA-methyltransferase
MIIIPAGWTNKHRGRENPEEFFKKTFPALYKHFMNFSNVKTRGKGCLIVMIKAIIGGS